VILVDLDGEIALSSPDAGRWLAEHSVPQDIPAGCPGRLRSGLRVTAPAAGQRAHRLPGARRSARLLLEETMADMLRFS
jgi:hypothetical protein